MIENIVIIYGLIGLLFLFMIGLSASNAVKFSNSARNKEIRQFYKKIAGDNLKLIKWSPLWPIPVFKDIIELIKWHFNR